MKEELKTLKDFDYGGLDGADILKDALKEEAENWIAKMEKKIKEKERQYHDLGVDLDIGYAKAEEAIIGFIKHFFNLEG